MPSGQKEVEAIYREIEAQTDRGAAIIATAILEDALADALKNRLILTSNRSERIFSHEKNGPLASLSSKIDMAAATGLLTKEICDQLHVLRRIRNKFAHSIEPLKFSDPEISQWMSSMKTGVKRIDGLANPRERYTYFAVSIASVLLVLRHMPGLKIKPANLSTPGNQVDFMRAFFQHVAPQHFQTPKRS